ncbi:hypothetical protein GIW59_10185, partial [Pseudomonas gessardii]|nr:hypothetical protein [Pseudomonas gessardii]
RGHQRIQGIGEHHQHREAGVDQHASEQDAVHAEAVRQGRHGQAEKRSPARVADELAERLLYAEPLLKRP